MLIWACCLSGGRAEELPLPVLQEPVSPIKGKLVICGGGILPEVILDRFVELSGGAQAKVVLITTASQLADQPEEMRLRLNPWFDRKEQKKLADVHILHTRDPQVANSEEFVQPLKQATGVWFVGGIQGLIVDAYRGTKVEQQFRAVLERDGTIGGTSAGAAIMSPVMIRQGDPDQIPQLGQGFGFLPGTIVDQHFVKRKRQNRLMQALNQYPGLVGTGIDEGTALVVQGRRCQVIGESDVVTCLPQQGDLPPRVQVLKPGSEIDLVALSRAATERARRLRAPAADKIQADKIQTDKTPADKSPDVKTQSSVSKGTLLIVGGGSVPDVVTKRFLEAAGGVDAPLVVISTAMGDQPPPEKDLVGWLVKAGATNVKTLHTRHRRDAFDPEVRKLISQAKGVWFTGGRQWRLVDAYLDTPLQQDFEGILERGGVIGGTSAGATIQAEYLVRGSPLGNREIMAEGYERGFGFLTGVAIDQHFTQRNRFGDMSILKQAHPHLVGLGIDEATALLVRGTQFEVIGKNRVAVYDRCNPMTADVAEYDMLQAGDQYDLKDRKRILLADQKTPAAGGETVAESTSAGVTTASTVAAGSGTGTGQPNSPLAGMVTQVSSTRSDASPDMSTKSVTTSRSAEGSMAETMDDPAKALACP